MKSSEGAEAPQTNRNSVGNQGTGNQGTGNQGTGNHTKRAPNLTMTDPATPPSDPSQVVHGWPLNSIPLCRGFRIYCFLTGVILPLGCYVASFAGLETMDGPWQSGRLKHYLGLTLMWPTVAVFLPLVLASMAAMTVWTVRPAAAGRWPVRLGMYSGALLASHYYLVSLIATGLLGFFSASMMFLPLIVVCVCLSAMVARFQRFQLTHLLVLVTGCAVLSLALSHIKDDALSMLVGIALAFVIAGPTLNVITYVMAVVLIVQRFGIKRPQRSEIGAWLSWLGLYAVGWKLTVDLMLREYAKLPTTPPNCYVSAAAASGHTWLVRAQPVRRVTFERTATNSHRGRSPSMVNPQMARLKFLEFALAAAIPRLHRWIRRIYDRVGPRMAGVCRRHRLLADAAYLSLVPLELIAESLRRAARFDPKAIADLYHDRHTRQ